jgi:hypothetical protein
MASNMRVDHNLGDLRANQDYVMTLKDQGVLDSASDDNEEIQLENSELQTDFKSKVLQKRKNAIL